MGIGTGFLDVGGLGGQAGDDLGHSIQRELRKLEGSRSVSILFSILEKLGHLLLRVIDLPCKGASNDLRVF
jgi:hypothetical protein